MNKKNKACIKARGVLKQARLFFFAGIALTMALPSAMAQQSLTSSATQGLWDNEADRFMDVNDYDTVEFDKFYGLLQGGGGGNISGGFAKNFGSVYLGLYYYGNLASGSSVEEKDADGEWLTNAAGDNGIYFYNQLYTLIGTPVGGFKLGLMLNGFRTDTDESLASTVEAKSGSFGVSLTWGNNFALGDGVLKPEVELGYYFDLNERETTPKPSGDTTTTHSGSSQLTLGFRGTYEFAPGASSQSSLTLEDTISVQFPTNPRSKSTVLGVTTTTEQEGNQISNGLYGSFAKTYDLDGRFSAGWNVGLSFYVTLDPVKTTATSGSATTTTSDRDTTTIQLVPTAGVGFTYKFVPDRFTLNGGVTAYYGYTHQKWEDNRATGTALAETTYHYWDGLYMGGSLGGTLYFSPKVFLEFSTGAGLIDGYFDIDLSYFSLLVSVRN
jgi:hypothetical protein